MLFWDIFFPVDKGLCMAAFIGTTVLLLNGKKRVKSAMITMVVANYLTSVYLTALVAEMSDLKNLQGIAFAIGAGGFSLIDRLINQIINRITNVKDDGGTTNNTAE